ncbi:MAG: outer membrane lipoprotein-sorting protein [Myxococcota bacterium]
MHHHRYLRTHHAWMGLFLSLSCWCSAEVDAQPAAAPAVAPGAAAAADKSSSTALPSAEELLARIDKNRDFTSTTSTATMRIFVGTQERVKKMKIESLTAKRYSLVEFMNPEDKGTRYLMMGDNLWIYFPEEDDVVKISGHMLKEGMMGSDVSYEDALQGDTLSQKYALSVQGVESINGQPCYVLSLDAKVKEVPYEKRKMWVDQKHYIVWKEELYAKSGKLLKVSQVLEAKNVEGRTVPVKVEMRNMLKQNTRTLFESEDIRYNVNLSEDRFSMQSLRR